MKMGLTFEREYCYTHFKLQVHRLHTGVKFELARSEIKTHIAEGFPRTK
jgi:hypothetical protein